MKSGRILLVLLLVASNLQAQTDLDVAFATWKNPSKSNAQRSEAYLDYIWDGYVYSNPDSAIILAEDLLLFAKKTKDRRITELAYNVQGVAYYVKGDNTRALERWNRSLKIATEIKHKSGISSSLTNIGNIYADEAQHDKALSYYKRGLVINKELDNKNGMAQSLSNIGSVYFAKKDYPKAREYFLEGSAIEEKSKYGVSNISLSNLGGVYSAQGDFPVALDYFERALAAAKVEGDVQGEALAFVGVGIVKYRQEAYTEAIAQFEVGYDILKEINALGDQKEACDFLYKSHRALGNNEVALEYLESFQKIDQELNREETAQQIQRMEFAEQTIRDSIYQVDKDRAIAEDHREEVRKKDRTRNWLMAGGLFVLLLAGSLFPRVRYIRRSKATLQVEKDRSENLLLNILPADIAAELKEKGSAEAKDFEQISILFTDFKGFTAASEKLSAQDLVAELNVCFGAFDNIMEKYGIEKIKTIGDAYMAAGGLTSSADSAKIRR